MASGSTIFPEGQISYLSVRGYKAVRKRQQMKIANLTLIAGANSSGKSSFIQPFLMMKQTLDSAFDPGPMLLHGPNVKVTDHTQIFSRGKSREDSVDRFTVGIHRGDESREVTFSSSGKGNLQIVMDESVGPLGRVSLSDPLTAKQRRTLEAEYSPRFKSLIDSFAQRNLELKIVASVVRNRCFLEPVVRGQRGLFPEEPLLTFDLSSDHAESWAVNFLRGIIHVPGLRGNPERAYPRSATGDTYPGTFETYVASIILHWIESNSKSVNQLAADLEQLGLTWKVVARRLNDASIEIMVGRMPHAQQGGAHDLVNVADVGFGVSQTLPVLVALLTAKRGQVVYVEQPEIHLHPKAQLALANCLVSAAKRGVIVIAETHSSLLIRGVQIALARGQISPENVSLNWFVRDPINGSQSISVAEVDEHGRFGEWPIDFDEVSRGADWTFIDAAEGF